MDQMSLNDENPLCWNLALTFRDTGSCIDPSALGIAINAVALFTGARFPSRINLSLSLSLSAASARAFQAGVARKLLTTGSPT